MALFGSGSKAEINRLLDENEELRNSLHKALSNYNSLEELETKLSDARNTVSELAKEEKELEEFIQHANEDKVNKAYFIAEMEKKIKSLEDTRINLEKSINRYNTELEEFDEIKVQRRQNIEKLTKDISEKEQSLEQIEKIIISKNKTIESLDKNITKLKSSEETIKTNEHELSTNIVSKEKELEELLSKLKKIDNDNNRLNENINSLKKETNSLENRKQELLLNIESLNEAEKEKKETISNLSNVISSNQNIKANLDASLSSLTNLLTEKDRQYNEFATRKDKIVEEIMSAKNELDNTRHDIQANKIVLEEFNEEIDILEKKKNILMQNVESLEVTKKSVERSLVIKQGEEESYKTQLTILRNKVVTLEEKKFEIEESNLQLEKKFNDTLENFESEAKELKVELNNYKQLLLHKTRELKNVESSLLEKSTIISEYTGMVKVLKKEKENLESGMEKMNVRKGELSENLTKLRDDYNKLKLSIKEMQTANESLLTNKSYLEREISELLSKSNSSYEDQQLKNQELADTIGKNENRLDQLNEAIEEKTDELLKINDDISKAELDREEFATKISQLIALEKTFQAKIENYKDEINNIEIVPKSNSQENNELINLNKNFIQSRDTKDLN